MLRHLSGIDIMTAWATTHGFSIRHGLVWGSDIKPGLEMPRARYVGG